MLVTAFDVDELWWSPSLLTATWHLVAVHAEPFLVGDDVLIEVRHKPVDLVEVSLSELSGPRIRGIQTCFDEAMLMARVLLGMSESPAE